MAGSEIATVGLVPKDRGPRSLDGISLAADAIL